MISVGFVSLGCAKNQVDSELILGVLQAAGIRIVVNPEEADAIIINTCGFIESARQETVETILEMKSYGKKLIVAGCYAERYRNELEKDMPFVDRIITLKDYPRIHLILADVFGDTSLKFLPLSYERRMLVSSSVTPYIKISEGCDNRCAFCAIPLIRGSFRSRNFDEIVAECEQLVRQGAKELNLISQDTTRYGTDLTKDHSSLLPKLLNRLTEIEGIVWVRMLYLYPDEINEELIETVAKNPKIAPYFDIPIQHISTPVLKRMLRRKDEAFHRQLFQRIRERIPHAIFRSTLITGFPGETEEDHQKLVAFLQEAQIDRLGVFPYSKEEGTKAYQYLDEIDPETIQRRHAELMSVQKRVARKLNRSHIGGVYTTIIEAYDPSSKFYYGRSYAFAPDDIDGQVVFQSTNILQIGDVVNVKITDAFGYDLIGDAILQEE